jgi:hypothetical protein
MGGFLILVNLGYPFAGAFFVEIVLVGFSVIVLFLFGYFLSVIFSLNLFLRSIHVEYFVVLLLLSFFII